MAQVWSSDAVKFGVKVKSFPPLSSKRKNITEVSGEGFRQARHPELFEEQEGKGECCQSQQDTQEGRCTAQQRVSLQE